MIEDRQILDILIKEGYPVFMHEKTILKIKNFSEQVSTAFRQWIIDNAEPDITIEGYSSTF